MTNKSKEFVEAQCRFFESNTTLNPVLLGLEFEHILINKYTMRSYQYFESNGQKEILEFLNQRGWRIIVIEDGNIMGIEKEGHTITLEPGGQIEISLKAYATLKEIDLAYRVVVADINEALNEEQILISVGYHPLTKIETLSILPKKRYDYMYNYFTNKGLYCHNMMMGTASTQVSIDYRDEADFKRKFRVANFLSPIFANIFDATPVFEGEKYSDYNCRLKIWEQTDIKRSKLIPGSLDRSFGYEDYANYLLSIPPIFIVKDGNLIDTGDKKLDALFSEYSFTESEREHILSMVFPDVRVKRYIEIRMADALPYPLSLGFPMLIKAIFYNKELLDKYYDLSLKAKDEDVKRLNHHLITHKDGEYCGFTVSELQIMIMVDAIEILSDEEIEVVEVIKNIITSQGSIKEWLSKVMDEDTDKFLKLIEAPVENLKEMNENKRRVL